MMPTRMLTSNPKSYLQGVSIGVSTLETLILCFVDDALEVSMRHS